MGKEFKNKEEVRRWFMANIPLLIRPTKRSKYTLVTPFSSGHAANAVLDYLVDAYCRDFEIKD
jgi:hypothetical protein